MKVWNCGLQALDDLKTIEKVSAYSLIQMAKENGVNLLVYHVDIKDLMRVPRPAILHATDHFLYVKNGEPLPNHQYTGFVLAQKGFKGSRIVSYVEAKQIMGAKKGGVARIVVPTILGIISGGVLGLPLLVSAGVGAASNIGMDQYAKSQHPEQLGQPGQTGDILGAGALGALSGAGGASLATGAKAGIAAAKAAGTTGTGNLAFAAAKGALVGTPATMGGQPISVINPAAAAANPAFKAGTAGLLASGGSLATTKNPYTLNPIGVSNYVNSPATTGFNMKNIGTAASMASGASAASKFLGMGQGDLTRAGIGLAASQIGKPDTSYLNNALENTKSNYSALKTYVGNNVMPAATQEQLLNDIHTPLDQMTSNLSFNNEPAIRAINTSFDRQIQQVQRAYSMAGQGYTNSSDARDQVQKINNDRALAIKDATAEISNQNLGRAIQAKQFALSQAMQQGQFDSGLAFELAKMAGQEKELKLAIDSNNYEQFQTIIANILNMGYANQQNAAMKPYLDKIFGATA